MAPQRSLRNKSASVVNRLLYAVGGVFVVISNVRPNVKNVRFGKGREEHKRSSFRQAPVVFHRLNFTANLSTVNKFAALGL